MNNINEYKFDYPIELFHITNQSPLKWYWLKSVTIFNTRPSWWEYVWMF